MTDAYRTAHALVPEVRIKIAKVFRLYQALVNHGQVREGHHVIQRIRVRQRPLLFECEAAGREQLPFDVMGAPARGRVYEDLVDGRHARQGLLANDLGADGNFAPANDIQRQTAQMPAQNLLAPLDQFVIGREKHQARSKTIRQFEAAVSGDFPEKRLRELEHDSATVTGFAVSGYGASVSEARQRFQRGLNEPVAFLPIHVCQQSESAAIPEIPLRVM